MAKKSKTKTKAKAKSKTKKKAVKARAKKTARPNSPRAKAAPRRKKAGVKRAKKPSAQPKGYSSVTAYLIAQDASGAIAYYKEVFGAKEQMRMPAPGGKIGHAELKIGDSKIMLADEFPEMNARGPRHHNGSPVTIMLYVKDVDATVAKAVAKGGKLVREVKDQFYGDRSGAVEDPEGHIWHISTHIEDVTPKVVKRRMEAMMAEGAKAKASAEVTTATEPA